MNQSQFTTDWNNSTNVVKKIKGATGEYFLADSYIFTSLTTITFKRAGLELVEGYSIPSIVSVI